ncbi:hypothetical protein DDK22_17620 [Cupriavidus necator]|uniref:Uncharacterized protein n=1 Tax=Cupriavidus necator TaxID=106590 RepID=A0A367PH89_CUPNE|nr:hypothetical protein DDK22_17620 [Cupriavidus necator]
MFALRRMRKTQVTEQTDMAGVPSVSIDAVLASDRKFQIARVERKRAVRSGEGGVSATYSVGGPPAHAQRKALLSEPR